MLPYKLQFKMASGEVISFESNEKPFKGEVFTIHEKNGTEWKARITEVVKSIVRGSGTEADLRYDCCVEEYKDKDQKIGFSK